MAINEYMFDDLVKKFYANIRVLKGGDALESLVTGKRIVLNEK